jgi:hypothetical protein
MSAGRSLPVSNRRRRISHGPCVPYCAQRRDVRSSMPRSRAAATWVRSRRARASRYCAGVIAPYSLAGASNPIGLARTTPLALKSALSTMVHSLSGRLQNSLLPPQTPGPSLHSAAVTFGRPLGSSPSFCCIALKGGGRHWRKNSRGSEKGPNSKGFPRGTASMALSAVSFD